MSRDTCTPLCGNGRIDMGEECDDGNIIIGDGCSSCRIEFAWTCDTHNCSKKWFYNKYTFIIVVMD